MIVDQVEDRNPAAYNGMTPLHIASQRGHVNVCRLFLDNSDDSSPVTLDGKTPLDMARQSNNRTIVWLLKKNSMSRCVRWVHRCAWLGKKLSNPSIDGDFWTQDPWKVKKYRPFWDKGPVTLIIDHSNSIHSN